MFYRVGVHRIGVVPFTLYVQKQVFYINCGSSINCPYGGEQNFEFDVVPGVVYNISSANNEYLVLERTRGSCAGVNLPLDIPQIRNVITFQLSESSFQCRIKIYVYTCQAGFYMDSEHNCQSCDVNSSSSAGSLASTACVCNSGFAGPRGGACMQCAVGKFRSVTWNVACHARRAHTRLGLFVEQSTYFETECILQIS